MTSRTDQTIDALLEAVADELARRVMARVGELEGSGTRAGTPWLTTAEAVEYTRLATSTFRKLAACGILPSHGGRAKLFYRPELDTALMQFNGIADEQRQLKRVG